MEYINLTVIEEFFMSDYIGRQIENKFGITVTDVQAIRNGKKDYKSIRTSTAESLSNELLKLFNSIPLMSLATEALAKQLRQVLSIRTRKMALTELLKNTSRYKGEEHYAYLWYQPEEKGKSGLGIELISGKIITKLPKEAKLITEKGGF